MGPDTELAQIKAELHRVCEANTRQAGCINLCAYYIGPKASATIEGLPNAVAHLVAKADRLELHLGNLLARIHHDGGQYLAMHGVQKAVEDAELIIAKLNNGGSNEMA